VIIAIEGGADSRTFEGETIMVNLHGASIATAIGLSRGMRISIRVYLTDKRASARVVYIDPENPLHCGIELAEPRNIWGVPLPPDDWEEKGTVWDQALGGRGPKWFLQQVCSKKRSVFRELLETPLKNLSSLTRTKIGPHGSNLKPFETG
jgi:hypothetical protein